MLLVAVFGLLAACRAPELDPAVPERATLPGASSSTLTPPPPTPTPIPPTPTPVPPTPTPLPPTPTPAPPPDPFLILVKPLVDEAEKRRAERAAVPAYLRRIDSALNQDRINFFLLGYGPTYEPPFQAIIGSPTILSLHLPTRAIDLVSLTHDIRAPEIETYQKARGISPDPTKIDQAYEIGGFDLMRLVIEDATGFSVDFQIAMDDQTVAGFVDQVMGKLEIDLPVPVDTIPYIRDRVLQPAGHFAAGPNQMDGLRVLQYMKALSAVHDPATERNVRKSFVLAGIFAYLQAHATDPFFWFRAVDFTNREVANGYLHADFDLSGLVLGNVSELARGMITLAGSRSSTPVMPHLGRSLYVVDVASGDGGVEWATLSANPIARRDLARHVYPNPFFAIPFASDPYAADLPNNYWWSVRQLIRNRLLGRPLTTLQQRKEARIDRE